MKRIILFTLVAVAFASCQKVINVDLNQADPVTVIEANYTAEDSTVRVRITKTSNYFGADAEPTVDNATITITDHLGAVQTIPFVSNGDYVLTNYIPQFNTQYTITAVVDGVQHIASCNLYSPVAQDDIYYEFQEQGFFGGSGYLCFLVYNDPAAEGNYYQAIYSVNDTIRGKLDEMILMDDDVTNGNLVARPIFSEFMDLGDVVKMELRTIDKRVYDYYTELLSLTDPSSAAPANPDYFWSNRALGYFNAYGNSRKEVTIQ